MRVQPASLAQLALAIPVLACLACGHPIGRKIEGRWLGEAAENFGVDEVAVATGWARGVSLEFSGEKLKVTIPAEAPREARFSVSKVRDIDVHLLVASADGAKDRLHLKLDDESTMRWMLSEGKAIVLRRSQ